MAGCLCTPHPNRPTCCTPRLPAALVRLPSRAPQCCCRPLPMTPRAWWLLPSAFTSRWQAAVAALGAAEVAASRQSHPMRQPQPWLERPPHLARQHHLHVRRHQKLTNSLRRHPALLPSLASPCSTCWSERRWCIGAVHPLPQPVDPFVHPSTCAQPCGPLPQHLHSKGGKSLQSRIYIASPRRATVGAACSTAGSTWSLIALSSVPFYISIQSTDLTSRLCGRLLQESRV